LPRCANHPDREGFLRCKNCGKYFCDACAEGDEDHAYCFKCLKEIAIKSKRMKHGTMTLPVVIGALISVALGLLVIYNNAWLFVFPTFVFSPSISEILDFISTPGTVMIGLAFGAMFGYFILAIGMISERKWAVYFGIALNVAMFLYKYCMVSQGLNKFNDQFVLTMILITLLTLILIDNRNKIY